jgi:CxxC motif-containing protein (DUF1111 family)
MKRLVAAALLCALPPIAAAQRVRAVGPGPRPVRAAPPGDPFVASTVAERALFNAGKAEFEQLETIETGLGPVFNSRACSECHLVPAIGGSSERLVTRIGKITDSKFDPLTQFGGSLLQARGIGKMDGVPFAYGPELVPSAATIVALRRSTSTLGLGLVEATPDATFIALAAEQAARNDGTAGRVHMVDNPAAGMKTMGKFGWKAQVPTLFQFSGEAYLNEMGITNPGFPTENCPSGDCAALQFNPRPSLNDGGEGVKALTDFMTFLAPPPRGPITAEAIAGEAVFNQIGCGACHVSTLQTGANSNPVFDRVTYHPYSDFLLHDMGALGDGIEQGSATGKEIRTAPLWGLRFVTTLLHDGRTTSLQAAIDAHDGQARAARDAYVALPESDRVKLITFLKSL